MKNQRRKEPNPTARNRIKSPDFATISRKIFGDRTLKGDAVEMEQAGYDKRARWLFIDELFKGSITPSRKFRPCHPQSGMGFSIPYTKKQTKWQRQQQQKSTHFDSTKKTPAAQTFRSHC